MKYLIVFSFIMFNFVNTSFAAGGAAPQNKKCPVVTGDLIRAFFKGTISWKENADLRPFSASINFSSPKNSTLKWGNNKVAILSVAFTGPNCDSLSIRGSVVAPDDVPIIGGKKQTSTLTISKPSGGKLRLNGYELRSMGGSQLPEEALPQYVQDHTTTAT